MTPEETKRLDKIEQTVKDQERRLSAVVRELADWRTEAQRLRQEGIAEHNEMVEGAKRQLAKAIEKGLEPLDKAAAEISATLVLTKDQTALLMDSKEGMEEMRAERLRRRAIDEVKAENEALAAKKKAADELQEAKDIEKLAKDREYKLKVWATVIALLAAVGTLAGFAINSHH